MKVVYYFNDAYFPHVEVKKLRYDSASSTCCIEQPPGQAFARSVRKALVYTAWEPTIIVIHMANKKGM